MERKSLNDVKSFWEKNPLFHGESSFEPGTREFFEEHRRVVVEDCLAGVMDKRLIPNCDDGRILDLGCGPGLWTVEFLKRGANNVVAGDLTDIALKLTRKRLIAYDLEAEVVHANAENMIFRSNSFDHVNCQGVIHHTPDTEKCVAEIARVLKPGGGAVISVYYRNMFLRHWNLLNPLGKLLAKQGAELHGRGRENIYSEKDINEITRIYDGVKNPIGKSYSREAFVNMLEPHFEIKEIFYHFFPARSLPVIIPRILHKWLDKKLPFMIFARLQKPW